MNNLGVALIKRVKGETTDNIEQAITRFKLALEVEQLAHQYCETLKLGNPQILDQQQMAAVLDKFRDYGQRT